MCSGCHEAVKVEPPVKFCRYSVRHMLSIEAFNIADQFSQKYVMKEVDDI